MIDEGPPPPNAPKGVMCPVCCGAGRWEKRTGIPIFFSSAAGVEDLMKCVYCNGERSIPYIPDNSGSRR